MTDFTPHDNSSGQAQQQKSPTTSRCRGDPLGVTSSINKRIGFGRRPVTSHSWRSVMGWMYSWLGQVNCCFSTSHRRDASVPQHNFMSTTAMKANFGRLGIDSSITKALLKSTVLPEVAETTKAMGKGA